MELQTFLNIYGGISFEDSDNLTMLELEVVRDKVIEIVKTEKKQEAENMKGLAHTFSGIRFK